MFFRRGKNGWSDESGQSNSGQMPLGDQIPVPRDCAMGKRKANAKFKLESSVLRSPSRRGGAFGNSIQESFRALHCYLIDLCENPADQLSSRQRLRARRDGEARLVKKFRQLRPEIVVTILRGITKN